MDIKHVLSNVANGRKKEYSERVLYPIYSCWLEHSLIHCRHPLSERMERKRKEGGKKGGRRLKEKEGERRRDINYESEYLICY